MRCLYEGCGQEAIRWGNYCAGHSPRSTTDSELKAEQEIPKVPTCYEGTSKEEPVIPKIPSEYAAQEENSSAAPPACDLENE